MQDKSLGSLEGLDDESIPNDPLATPAKAEPIKAERDDKPRKLSIRESIEDATKSVREKNTEPTPEVGKGERTDKKPAVVTDKEDKKGVREAIEEASKPKTKDKVVEANANKDEQNEPDKKTDKPQYSAPKGWPKEAKEQFDTLPEAIQAAIQKREDEASKGFKEYGEKAKRLEEYDNLVKRYVPDHQKYGATPAQVVERSFKWIQALANPNKSQAAANLKQLATNFGLMDELAKQFAPATSNNAASDTNPRVANAGINQSDDTRIQDLEKQIADIRNSQSNKDFQTVKVMIDNWSKDKPHFEKVRATMKTLLESGVITLQTPDTLTPVDLDAAYDRAVKLDPELYQQIVDAEVEAREKAIREEADKKVAAAKNLADVNRSRAANVSIPNRASTVNSNTPRNNKSATRKDSIRDSIGKAIAEVRGT